MNCSKITIFVPHELQKFEDMLDGLRPSATVIILLHIDFMYPGIMVIFNHNMKMTMLTSDNTKCMSKNGRSQWL